jgi:hypothetical protein
MMVAFVLVLLALPYAPSFMQGNPTLFPILFLFLVGGFAFFLIKGAME